ncbi:MAG: histidine phosphatase family protein [Verrucomicrobia bacterium]|nr:histidine phosphatase family protein [Verrucomicrobiota bacterium]
MASRLQMQTSSQSKTEHFRHELGLEVNSLNPSPKICSIFLVQHGSTDWSDAKRLQGWGSVNLNTKGIEQLTKRAEVLKNENIQAIYSSTIASAIESAQILRKQVSCPLVGMNELRGEFHGKFEGFTKDQYTQEKHFQEYDKLSPHEEIFFPCGEEGESKADVARRAVPALKHIAQSHIGQNVVVVTHGALFKLFNYYLGNFTEEEGTKGIPYGDMMRIEADADHVYLKKI